MNILEEIIAYKKIEVDKAKSILSLEQLKKLAKEKKAAKRFDFYKTIKNKVDKKQIALIAEIKKASPSKGIIKEGCNHIEIAKAYKSGGAACLSVLTDEKYFQGKLAYISEIKKSIDLPILRKDFIVDSYQIYESKYNQADCILLIVGALEKDMLKRLLELSQECELCSLIEVHDEKEMEVSLDIVGTCRDMTLQGINNRDLKTFKTNIETTKQLVEKYKKDLKDKIIVSESGISNRNDVQALVEHNVYSFLVGESLLIEKNIEEKTRQLIGG